MPGAQHAAAATCAWRKVPLGHLQGLHFNEMRSKTKCISSAITSMDAKDFPTWSFDGSSTGQAEGNNSDCILQCVSPRQHARSPCACN